MKKANNTIKLTEAKLNKLIKESIHKILKESSTDNNITNMWYEAQELMGAESMLDALYHFLDSDTIANFIQTLKREYELPFNGYDNDDEEEYLNEIGDTPKGNFALNAVRGRRAAKGYRTNMGVKDKAENERVMGMASDTAYKNYSNNKNLGFNNDAGYRYGFDKGVEKYTK